MKVSVDGWECDIPQGSYASEIKTVRLKTPDGPAFHLDVPTKVIETIVEKYRSFFGTERYERSWAARANKLHACLNKLDGFRWNIVDVDHDRDWLLKSSVRNPSRRAFIEFCGWKGEARDEGLWVSWDVQDNRDACNERKVSWCGTEASLDCALIAASEKLLGGLDFQARATAEGLQK